MYPVTFEDRLIAEHGTRAVAALGWRATVWQDPVAALEVLPERLRLALSMVAGAEPDLSDPREAARWAFRFEALGLPHPRRLVAWLEGT